MATDAGLAAAISAAGFASGTPVTLAAVDATGRVRTAVAGRWPDGRPVSADDRFYAASLTKQITAAALALLVRDGVVDPDEPVSRWLPGYPGWLARITARQLLHHTSGLPPAGVLEKRLPAWTTEAVLESLADVELHAQGAHAYSNVGYILLAEVIASAAGETFAGYVERRLGLSFAADVATQPQAGMMQGPLPLTVGDGGLWIAARDFAAWLHRVNRDAYGVEGLVTAPGPGAPDYGWGLGIRSFRGHHLYSHGGNWSQACAKAVRCPALGIGVVAMTSAESGEEITAAVDASLDFLTTSGDDEL